MFLTASYPLGSPSRWGSQAPLELTRCVQIGALPSYQSQLEGSLYYTRVFCKWRIPCAEQELIKESLTHYWVYKSPVNIWVLGKGEEAPGCRVQLCKVTPPTQGGGGGRFADIFMLYVICTTFYMLFTQFCSFVYPSHRFLAVSSQLF